MAIENSEHIIMNCPATEKIRTEMCTQISNLKVTSRILIMSEPVDTISKILGNIPKSLAPETSVDFLEIVAQNVYKMYKLVLGNRERG